MLIFPVTAAWLLLSMAPVTPVAETINEQTLIDNLVNYDVDSEAFGPTHPQVQSCSLLCHVLPSIFPGHVLSNGTDAYTKWNSAFWSQQQAQVQPACIFKPTNPEEAAAGFLLAQLTACPFAVKSGGHAAFSGASNIKGGLTFDLAGLNTIELSSDKKVARVGTGSRWFDVYKALEPDGLTVIGGRVSDIGVGGLTLGGGVSFFSGRYGWACDNVLNYEVILASGSIAQVNQSSHPDLYWALRGGGNNFGIVTRFDLETVQHGLMWGGTLGYTIDSKDALVDAFIEYGGNSGADPDAALILSFAYAQGMFLGVADMEYAKPKANPPIFDSFQKLPTISNTLGVKSLVNVTLEFKESNPDGLRESYWTSTFRLDGELATFMVDTYMEEVENIKDAPGIVPALSLQIITADEISHMSKRGGNALGLAPSEAPLLLMNLNCMWSNEEDDTRILAALSNINSKCIAEGKSRGLYNDFVYMNYASKDQAVFPSYGRENYEGLQRVAERYDPNGIFQTLQPGYFKL